MQAMTRAVVLFAIVMTGPATAAPMETLCVPLEEARSLNPIVSTVYFNSKPQDAAQCRLFVRDGELAFPDEVTNPAMTCPDRFAWKMLIEAIEGRFWENWATDHSTFPGCVGGKLCDGTTAERAPASPLPLCRDGADPASCCDPDRADNPGYDNAWNPAIQCPWYPGDHDLEATPQVIGRTASKAHRGHGEPSEMQTTPAVDELEPDRVVRQAAAEVVYRNRPQWDYLFRNELYNQEGLMRVFDNVNGNVTGNLPYRDLDGSGGLVEIRLPVESVSIKTNWLSREFAERLGIVDEPPHIKMEIRTPTQLNPMTEFGQVVFAPGEYWLVAAHFSSKDIPKWTWATFEHVNNRGRCDFIGCNDSFGHASADPHIGPAQHDNFTAPHIRSDDLCVPSWVFDLGRTYPSGPPSDELSAVLAALGIGTGKAGGTAPEIDDAAWNSYRLKGSMTSYFDEIGHANVVGNSVTEGGFVSTSGCMTCHTRAAIGPGGTLPPPNSIFTNDVDTLGYGQAVKGRPNPMWFHADAQPPLFRAVPTDFIWGMIFANCVEPADPPAMGCKVPAQP